MTSSVTKPFDAELWAQCCSEEHVRFAKKGTPEYTRVMERFRSKQNGIAIPLPTTVSSPYLHMKNSDMFLNMMLNESYPFDADLWNHCCAKEKVEKPKRGTEEHEKVLKLFKDIQSKTEYKESKKRYYMGMYRSSLKWEEEAQRNKEMLEKRFKENPNWQEEHKEWENKRRESISWGW